MTMPPGHPKKNEVNDIAARAVGYIPEVVRVETLLVDLDPRIRVLLVQGERTAHATVMLGASIGTPYRLRDILRQRIFQVMKAEGMYPRPRSFTEWLGGDNRKTTHHEL